MLCSQRATRHKQNIIDNGHDFENQVRNIDGKKLNIKFNVATNNALNL